MWTLTTAGGDRVNVFDNMLERRPWENSGYRTWFQAMELGQTDRWMSSPIMIAVAKRGAYPEALSVQPRAPDAAPDKAMEPSDVWELYGPHWRNTLHALSVEDTIVFDTETTGTDKELDEAVSIAVQSYAASKGAEVKYHTLIAPRFPEKLLYQNADGKSAYDVNGIHPDDLLRQPTFSLVHSTLWEIMGGKNWVCWNTDFDVALLDSLCIRHRLTLIPRNRVVCAMKLLSPLAGKWDEGRGAYRWTALEEMAAALGLEFPDAHDAAADVSMTIQVMRWAYAQPSTRTSF